MTILSHSSLSLQYITYLYIYPSPISLSSFLPYLDHVVIVAAAPDLAEHSVQLIVLHETADVVKGGSE